MTARESCFGFGMAAAIAACATVKGPPPSAQCEAALREGAARYDARDWAGAGERYHVAREQCGASRSSMERLTDSQFAAQRLAAALHNGGDDDGAAEALVATITAPEPPVDSFAMLHQLHANLSSRERQRLADLASTIEAPIFVPEIRFEHLWVAEFGCSDGEAKIAMQSLLEGKGPGCVLDAIMFTCGDGPQLHRYFDFTADPRDKELRRRTGYDPCRGK